MTLLTTIRRRFTRRTSPRTFAAAVAIALLVMPVAEALAYFSATGTGNIAGAQVSTTASTVSLSLGGGTSFTYAGGSTSALVPGGTVTFPVSASCLTNCPGFVSSIRLAGFTSDKTGCDSVTLPGSFTAPNLGVNATVSVSGASVGSMTVTFVNLPSTNQNACLGAILTFQLATP